MHCALPDDLCILLVFSFAVPPFAKHNRSIHIGWREGVGLIEQRDHTEQYSPDHDTVAQSHRQTENEDTSISDQDKRKALCRHFKTPPAQTELLPHLSPPVGSFTVHATPNMLRLSNIDSALYLSSLILER